MRTLLLALVGLTSTLALAAQANTTPTADPIVRQVSVMVEEVYKDAQGQPARRLVPMVKLALDQEMVFLISFSNTGQRPADGVVITNPIAEGVAYLEGSAYGLGTDIDFSTDGGKTWGKPVALVVKGRDGKVRPATGADYTHIRWKLLAAMAPAQKSSVQFRGVLK